MDNYISREKTIESIKTDLSQFVYDEYGNMTALGVRLIYHIGSITGVEPFGNLIDRDELMKDIKSQTERDGRTLSDVIAKGVLEVFLDYIRNFPSARPVNEMTEKKYAKQKDRECASCKHSNNGECAYTEECHECMWKSQYEQRAEQKHGHWIDEGQYADGHSSHVYRCSECGGHIIECRPDDFCKHCGADMREVDG